jgi:pyruvate formate lyase activating enzyme
MTVDKVFEEMVHCGEFIDAVVFTGGEPTLQPKALFSLCRLAKQENLLVKVHTNGSKPGVVKELVARRLVDVFAVDLKASDKKYAKAAGVEGVEPGKVWESIEEVKKSECELEVVVPVIKGLNYEQVPELTKKLGGCRVVLTEFQEENVLSPAFNGKKVGRDELHVLGRKCRGEVFVQSKAYGLEPV